MDGNGQKLGLSDLLDQDISSYEYFYSLPKNIQNIIKQRDASTFSDMQRIVYENKF